LELVFGPRIAQSYDQVEGVSVHYVLNAIPRLAWRR